MARKKEKRPKPMGNGGGNREGDSWVSGKQACGRVGDTPKLNPLEIIEFVTEKREKVRQSPYKKIYYYLKSLCFSHHFLHFGTPLLCCCCCCSVQCLCVILKT